MQRRRLRIAPFPVIVTLCPRQHHTRICEKKKTHTNDPPLLNSGLFSHTNTDNGTESKVEVFMMLLQRCW